MVYPTLPNVMKNLMANSTKNSSNENKTQILCEAKVCSRVFVKGFLVSENPNAKSDQKSDVNTNGFSNAMNKTSPCFAMEELPATH